ncbi:MAG: hypothetical protein RR386_06785 [Bacteroidaceae bacterium]
MKRILLSALGGFVVAVSSFGQNSAVYKADILFNDEKKVLEAEEIITPALTNPKTTKLAMAFNIAGNVQSTKLASEIEKASRKEACDTTLFINSLNKAVEYFTKSHFYDVKPNEKGKVKSVYVANNHKMISQMLDYYAYAAGFLNARKDYDGAYDCFEKAIAMPKNPIFSQTETDSIYKSKEEDYAKWSYFATMIAYKKNDWDAVLKNVNPSLKDTMSVEDGYTMKLSALQHKKNIEGWILFSKEAIKIVPGNITFCQNILSYYDENKLVKEAQETAEEITKTAPQSKMAHYAQGCVYLNTLREYTKARSAFKRALELDPSFLQANFNMGVCYINEIVSKKDQYCTDTRKPQFKIDKEKILDYYRKACPYFEKVRELTPNSPANWGSYLKNIYYNLELKDKEKELDAAINRNQ